MLGSAVHHTTGASMRWLLEQFRRQGIPKGLRVVVVGRGTEDLLSSRAVPPQIYLRGCVEQEELERLLLQAEMVLAPQDRGFGALTKLSELSCAGIPVLTSEHALHALDPPPGVYAMDGRCESWIDAMQDLRGFAPATIDEYEAWHAAQDSTLAAAIEQRLAYAEKC